MQITTGIRLMMKPTEIPTYTAFDQSFLWEAMVVLGVVSS